MTRSGSPRQFTHAAEKVVGAVGRGWTFNGVGLPFLPGDGPVHLPRIVIGGEFELAFDMVELVHEKTGLRFLRRWHPDGQIVLNDHVVTPRQLGYLRERADLIFAAHQLKTRGPQRGSSYEEADPARALKLREGQLADAENDLRGLPITNKKLASKMCVSPSTVGRLKRRIRQGS